ncbi:hypothetical protein INT43_004192 [Umbelopsis isabellina]|uniref:SWI/SNF and RSC complexes subunit Ssr4 C-terminal domain-containing protein n=1 Tax=Mortierella isabellina TaxID=91625 RepID=A0A8H7UAA0_MORIS|nr:hypothetical protein INT43_004192 [Umbelopsis isabellina]
MASAYYYNPGAGNLPNANMPAMHNVNQMQIGMQPNVYGQPQYRPQMPIAEAPNMRKRMPSKSKPAGPHQPTEDTDEPSGGRFRVTIQLLEMTTLTGLLLSKDELDDISTRDVAMARYKRNHDYLSEIFTPYTASSVVPPSFNLSKTEEQLKTQTQETDEEIARSKENHTAKINGIRQRIDEFWKDMQDLKSASELSDVSRTQQKVEETLELKIEKHSNIAIEISIPGLEAEEPPLDEASSTMPQESPGLDTNGQNANEPHLESEFEAQLMATNDQPEDIENKAADFSWQADQNQTNPDDENDFLFNEMMATTPTQEGTPSVNEFLNTPEFDGEKSPGATANDDTINVNITENSN